MLETRHFLLKLKEGYSSHVPGLAPCLYVSVSVCLQLGGRAALCLASLLVSKLVCPYALGEGLCWPPPAPSVLGLSVWTMAFPLGNIQHHAALKISGHSCLVFSVLSPFSRASPRVPLAASSWDTDCSSLFLALFSPTSSWPSSLTSPSFTFSHAYRKTFFTDAKIQP